ncbi:MAG: KAP family NTPase [Proteobacteria bacterium]|nr:KAP family NTPase [Pseudomonadota bacterium]
MTNQPTSNENMTFENSDIFNRKPFAEQLLKIINAMPDERVILLDAPWGEGKTVFAKMSEKYFINEGHCTVYYDVFADDYYEQPLLPFMEKIYRLAEKGTSKKEKEKLKNIILAVSKDFLNIFTAGAVSNSIEAIEKLLEKINENEDNLKKLKEYLTALPDNMTKDYKSKPIIFIIDELDRCKPTYAIKILEIIKHLFSVPNIVFLLVANSEQLCQSIKHEYGNDIDSYNYLHKFIHLRLPLPKQKNGTDNLIYINHCMDRLKFNSMRTDEIITISEKFSNHFQLSFREIERNLLTLKIMLSLLDFDPQKPISNAIVVTYIIIIKNKFPSFYTKLSNKNITDEEFKSKIKITTEKKI